ncbi:hypothetical protein LI012_14630 [Caldibacillus thermoamylovorans]|uniref:hypothetical protein n=1 Tax=Caldibacillus thermoamylovorans TaxID=35841 RepID=UPI001D087A9B|nr:hypothetical protein [Caldibacillus thermoamylovorans]MCB5936621.1 hypothetical protein [Bacillus sp. DFI.2.34]MCB7078043.1 hypothetical protein [Caldibacillus thermoamylovorans]
MIEHPDITYYNRHGYLRDQLEEERESEQWVIGRCANCNDFVMSNNEDLIRYKDHYYCCTDCLEEAFQENLLSNGNFKEWF